MSKQYPCPPYYRAPLKKRSDIVEWLIDESQPRSYGCGEGSLFCWNVKLYGLDLSFPHLIEVATGPRGDFGGEWWQKRLKNPAWMKLAQAEYDDVSAYLEEWGIDDARRGVKEDDGNRMIWDGETTLDVVWRFLGRSGGWLCLERFEGIDFSESPHDEEGWRERFMEMDYNELRLLYRFIVQCNHDFRREACVAEVEYQAAFNLFANRLEEIPLPPAPSPYVWNPERQDYDYEEAA